MDTANLLAIAYQSQSTARQSHELSIAEHLARLGHTVHLITNLPEDHVTEDVFPDTMRLHSHPDRLSDQSTPKDPSTVLDSVDAPDLDGVLGLGTWTLPLLKAAKTRWPQAPSLLRWDGIPLHQAGDYLDAAKASILSVDHISATTHVSREQAMDLLSHTDYHPRHDAHPTIGTRYDGVDTATIDHAEAFGSLSAMLPEVPQEHLEDIQGANGVVGTLGPVDTLRGHITALMALHSMSDHNRPPWLISGFASPTYSRVLQEQFLYHRVQARFLPGCNTLQAYRFLKSIDAYLAPGIQYTHPIHTALEAAYAGTPVIAWHTRALHQTTERGKGVNLVRRFDTADFASSILHALLDDHNPEPIRGWIQKNRTLTQQVHSYLSHLLDDPTGDRHAHPTSPGPDHADPATMGGLVFPEDS